MISIISTIIAILTLLIHIILLAFLSLYLTSYVSLVAESAVTTSVSWLHENRYLLAFLLTFAATLGSLFYSEIAGYDPCKLCWLQRVFMYPQVVILGIAWWLNDKSAWIYSLALSMIGFAVATYHFVLQLWPSQVANCSVVGQATSCSGTYLMQFGYITIPLMALTAFAVVIALMLTQLSQYRELT